MANSRSSGPKYLRITDIQNDTVDWSRVPSCNIEEDDVVKYKLQPGDLVFARTGATVGRSYLIRSGEPDSVFESYLIRIRFGSDVDPRYVACFFRSLSYWRQISESQAGIGQPNVLALPCTIKRRVMGSALARNRCVAPACKMSRPIWRCCAGL